MILAILSVIGLLIFNKYNEYTQKPDTKIPVLLYHNFVTTVPDTDPDNFNYINTPQSFEENINTILEDGYTIISMNELNKAINRKMELPSKPILITFDDGYYSNYEYIYPILQKYNVKASIFVVTDKVGKEIDGIKYLDWNECLEMQNSGLVEIFSHGKRHVFKDFIKRINVPCEMTGKEIIEEIQKID